VGLYPFTRLLHLFAPASWRYTDETQQQLDPYLGVSLIFLSLLGASLLLLLWAGWRAMSAQPSPAGKLASFIVEGVVAVTLMVLSFGAVWATFGILAEMLT
jgi:hypothetical protein